MTETDDADRGKAGFKVVDRRRLVRGGLAAVAGVGLATSTAAPARAANGGPVLLGTANTASATTRVTTSVGHGLQGASSASGGSGVLGTASRGNAVTGTTTAAGLAGVLGRNTNATGGWGVRGAAGTKGTGVRGETSDPGGWGVNGVNLSGTGSGVNGFSAGGLGVSGNSNSGHGVHGSGSVGVYGETNNYVGVWGKSGSLGYGVFGDSASGLGVLGVSDSGTGVFARSSTGCALEAQSSGLAARLDGDVEVQGDLKVVGVLSKGGGSFRIDHPTDPANMFLSHSFVESPDMMNVYNGTAVLDDNGEGTVQLPDWFEALNRDFRYQLTALDRPAPDLHVSSRIKDRSFTIAGGGKGQEVSWQVTGIRRDAWANANRIPVEEEKPPAQRGKYLHPELIEGGRAEPLHARPRLTTPPGADRETRVPRP
jgi:hypothetical protein